MVPRTYEVSSEQASKQATDDDADTVVSSEQASIATDDVADAKQQIQENSKRESTKSLVRHFFRGFTVPKSLALFAFVCKTVDMTFFCPNPSRVLEWAFVILMYLAILYDIKVHRDRMDAEIARRKMQKEEDDYFLEKV